MKNLVKNPSPRAQGVKVKNKVTSLLSFSGLTGESSSYLWIARSSMPSTTIGGRAMTTKLKQFILVPRAQGVLACQLKRGV